jgi:hypothetical protein
MNRIFTPPTPTLVAQQPPGGPALSPSKDWNLPEAMIVRKITDVALYIWNEISVIFHNRLLPFPKGDRGGFPITFSWEGSCTPDL